MNSAKLPSLGRVTEQRRVSREKPAGTRRDPLAPGSCAKQETREKIKKTMKFFHTGRREEVEDNYYGSIRVFGRKTGRMGWESIISEVEKTQASNNSSNQTYPVVFFLGASTLRARKRKETKARRRSKKKKENGRRTLSLPLRKENSQASPHFWRSRRVVLPARRTDRSKLKCNVHPLQHPLTLRSANPLFLFLFPPARASRPKMPRCSKRGKEPPSLTPSLRYKCRWFTASGLMEAVYC